MQVIMNLPATGVETIRDSRTNGVTVDTHLLTQYQSPRDHLYDILTLISNQNYLVYPRGTR